MMRALRLAALLLWLLPACAPRPATAPAPPAENLLVVGKAGDAVGLDPADVTEAESSQICASLYDTLVRFSDEGVEIEPGLAESWQVSEDGRTWTFTLRQGVKFHDGTAFDAPAVAFNFERQYNPESPNRFPGNQFVYWQSMWGQPSVITRVEALDERTVRFHLSEPCAPFLANLALPFFAIASPKAIQEHGEQFFRHPVGTGPFRFVEWVPKERIVLEANPDYWGGPPALERVVFRPVADSTSRQLQLQAGELHLIGGLLLENVAGLEKDPAATVTTRPGLNVGFMAFNTRKRPFDDPRVRQAIVRAIDRPALVEALYRGYAQVAESPVPPAIWGRAELEPYPYDPQEARRLLAEAGYPSDYEAELWYMPIARPYMPAPKEIAEAIAGMLAQVGVRTKLTTVDWSAYLDATGKGQHDMALLGWIADTGDPDNFLHVLLDATNADTDIGGSNAALYEDPEVCRWLCQARTLTDPAQRTELYLQAQERIHADAPWVPLAYAEDIMAHHPALEGFRLHPTGTLRLHGVRWKGR